MSTAAEHSRQYRLRHPDRVKLTRKKGRESSSKDWEYQRQYRMTRYDQLKQEALLYLGGACACCQFSDLQCLEIDHINPIRGERRLRGIDLFRSILAGNTDNLQVLCACCHMRKHSNMQMGE